MDEKRIDILLKEYEVCQTDIGQHTSRYWVAAAIFIGINTALLGVAAYIITPMNTSIDTEWYVWPIIVSVFGIGMIIALWSLEQWGYRINWLARAKYFRMREIESELQMKANIITGMFDNWESLSEEEKEKLKDMYARFSPLPSRIFPHIRRIYLILISLWVILIIFAWLSPILHIYVLNDC